ncbi:hypothetical protein C0J50_14317, partial [Silurus asotus]
MAETKGNGSHWTRIYGVTFSRKALRLRLWPETRCREYRFCYSVMKHGGFMVWLEALPNEAVVCYERSKCLVTTKSQERSSVELTEGGDVLLNCTFHFTAGYDQHITVYWIKTIERSSSCVYSYDLGTYGLTYNHHCNLQDDLLHRLSNESDSKTSHNIRIRNVTESDAGQYLCVLHVHTHYNKTRGNWKIIKNITVSVDKDKEPEILTYSSDGSQAIELQRNQNGDDTKEAADME